MHDAPVHGPATASHGVEAVVIHVEMLVFRVYLRRLSHLQLKQKGGGASERVARPDRCSRDCAVLFVQGAVVPAGSWVIKNRCGQQCSLL